MSLQVSYGRATFIPTRFAGELSQAVITLTAPLYSTNECSAKETLVQPGLTCPARSSLPVWVQFLVRDYPRVPL
jgi:hypothetical protein